MPKPFDINYLSNFLLNNTRKQKFFDIVQTLEYYNLFEKYTVNRIKSIASNLISIKLDNYPDSIEMISGGTLDIVDLNSSNVIDMYHNGYYIYFYVLLRDYIYDGDMYTTERITISENIMRNLMEELYGYLQSMNDSFPGYMLDINEAIESKIFTDAILQVEIGEYLDDTIHKAGPVKPELKISNMKKINTNSWWN